MCGRSIPTIDEMNDGLVEDVDFLDWLESLEAQEAQEVEEPDPFEFGAYFPGDDGDGGDEDLALLFASAILLSVLQEIG